jgi:hypothetical protein
MNVIEEINRIAISGSINKSPTNVAYCAIIGKEEFTPSTIIVSSSDFDCGALSNELEYARLATDYYVNALDPSSAEGDDLELVVDRYTDLPRLGSIESDVSYRDRFSAIITQNAYPSRCNSWSIINALASFMDIANIKVVEPFDSNNMYFQVRLSEHTLTVKVLALNNPLTGFLDNDYLGGESIGMPISTLSAIVQRIKAGGVDFDVISVKTRQLTTSIGSTVSV